MFSQEWKDHHDTKELVRILREELKEIQDSWVDGRFVEPNQMCTFLGNAQAIRLVLSAISTREE